MKKHISRLAAVLALSLLLAAMWALPGTLAFMLDSSERLVNTFVPDPNLFETVAVPIRIQKVVTCTGEKTIGPEDFTFVLTNTATGEESYVLSGWNGQARFDLTFDALDAGTHTYTVHELSNNRPGITYSDLVYTVEITISGEPAEAAITVNGEAVDTCSLTFENIYNSEDGPPDTGDHTNLALCALLMLLSGGGLLMMIRKGRRC